ncbi:hypothetical protein [Neorhizobium alkalisoli]|uniref:Uncharacterized protein n=1 Tax=Neorhizobium alkalisoli TaxID=528178 RepID=A0A561QUU1_9HYPH|nr:hypothetical protein [Neorhizobium alkalisoli]TWF54150.1 hypothetical protein FHW37_1039 [Neorhizobium alkalisoli]
MASEIIPAKTMRAIFRLEETRKLAKSRGRIEVMDGLDVYKAKGKPKPKFGAGTIILIGCCVTLAVVGIVVGAIVIYGSMQAVN